MNGRVTDSSIPDSVEWKYLQEFLSRKWYREVKSQSCKNDTRKLPESDLLYLAKRAFRHDDDKKGHATLSQYEDQLIQWNLFHRDRLVPKEAKKDFTFWKYFSACMTTAANHHKEWNTGIIFGFVWPSQVTDMLLKDIPGAFLVRFSERAIHKDQCQKPAGQLTLEVMYTNQAGMKQILKTRSHLSEDKLKMENLVSILTSMEYEDPNDKRIRNRFVKKLLRKENTPIDDFHEDPIIKGFAETCKIKEQYSKSSSYCSNFKTKILIDITAAERTKKNSGASIIDKNLLSPSQLSQHSGCISDVDPGSTGNSPLSQQFDTECNVSHSPLPVNFPTINSFQNEGFSYEHPKVPKFNRESDFEPQLPELNNLSNDDFGPDYGNPGVAQSILNDIADSNTNTQQNLNDDFNDGNFNFTRM